MNALLNIGMRRGRYGEDLHSSQVEHAMHSVDIDLMKAEVVAPDADSEATMVCFVERANPEKIYQLAEMLGQDCIAVYNLNNCVGRLIGPDAASWGEFNRDYFKVL